MSPDSWDRQTTFYAKKDATRIYLKEKLLKIMHIKKKITLEHYLALAPRLKLEEPYASKREWNNATEEMFHEGEETSKKKDAESTREELFYSKDDWDVWEDVMPFEIMVANSYL